MVEFKKHLSFVVVIIGLIIIPSERLVYGHTDVGVGSQHAAEVSAWDASAAAGKATAESVVLEHMGDHPMATMASGISPILVHSTAYGLHKIAIAKHTNALAGADAEASTVHKAAINEHKIQMKKHLSKIQELTKAPSARSSAESP